MTKCDFCEYSRPDNSGRLKCRLKICILSNDKIMLILDKLAKIKESEKNE